MTRMTFSLFNSRGRKTEPFAPLSKGSHEVKIYVCGVTPYDTTHLGHAFTYVSFDVLIRYLRFLGFKVNYTQNVTDIDDYILRKSRENGVGWRSLGSFWIKRYLNDMKALNVERPTHYVKATESILEIIGMVSNLVKKKAAYEREGNVYFDVASFHGYGDLSGFNEKQMMILLKERGGDPDDPRKKGPLDFLLWQRSGKGEPYWKSPWGNGRPGWHIECSAMIHEYLGKQIDIHGGGRDLIFPHHESEIAQSESFTGKSPFSNYFMHTAMVMHMGEKMAKSLGNLVLVSDLLKNGHTPNAIRWLLLSHHYRRIWEYDESELEEAEFYSGLISKLGKRNASFYGGALEAFTDAMDNDLDTITVLKILGELLDSEGRSEASDLVKILDILGFFRA